jgi:hypothetical protein
MNKTRYSIYTDAATILLLGVCDTCLAVVAVNLEQQNLYCLPCFQSTRGDYKMSTMYKLRLLA